jgi:glycosyltransferase involved in cell wall biosynthesis
MYILGRVRGMLRKCDTVIAPSQAIARIIQKVRPETPTRILPTGVDVNRFATGDGRRAREELGIGPDERVLLYVGRVSPEKNVGFLLRALGPILKTPPPGQKVRLVLVGGGGAMDACRDAAAKMGVADRVHLPGFAEGQRLIDFYHAGDVFTFASRTETQGLAIAEAMCAGIPPVVVNALGAPEAVTPGETGLVVPASEHRFREAVLRLLTQDKFRAQMAANAKAVSPGFSREQRVQELLDLYQELIDAEEHRNANLNVLV